MGRTTRSEDDRSSMIASVFAVVVGVLLCFLASPAASASCAVEPGPAGSPLVFVGTAVEERRGFTRFEVAEVWAGPDLADEVWVLSGQRQKPWPLSLLSGAASSIDADFTDGGAYVVGASREFRTNACRVAARSDTTVVPRGGPRLPVQGGLSGAEPPLGPLGQTIGVVTAVGLLIALVVGLRRLRHRMSRWRH